MKKLFALIFSLIAASVSAETGLAWFTVSSHQYEMAPCKTHDVPEYERWLDTQTKNLRNQVVKGFQFENQPSILINAFRDIVKNLPNQQSSCSSVSCAVDEIWGPQIGRIILYIRARHGFNTSEHAFSETRQLSQDEFQDILITLADLPPEMEVIGRGKNQRMVLAAEGKTHSMTPEAIADAGITFYDRWRKTDVFNRRYGLFHEFGHNLSNIKGNLDDSKEWKALASSCQVSIYGNNDNKEDFAESFVMYRFSGRVLQEKCPNKFEFLKKKVFSDRDYLDDTQCL